MSNKYSLGIDIGSTTVKTVITDPEGNIVYSKYQRHLSKVKETVTEQLKLIRADHPDEKFTVSITGSAGLGLANSAEIPFVQEVHAAFLAVKKKQPDADVVIELGGEDAKIIFLTGGVDIKRLNGNLLDILKDLLIFQKTGDANLMSSLTVSEAQDLSDDISARDANKMIAVLLKAQNDFRNVSNVRSLFELTLLQLCSIEEEEISTPVVKNKRPVETKTVVPEPVAPTPAPAPKAAPTASDVPDFVVQQPVVEEKPITPEPPVEEAIDLTDIKNTEVEKDGDRFELADEQVTNIMVLGKDNREERRELTKNWKQIEALKGHPTIGNLATLLAEGHPFCLCKEALLLTFNFTRLKNQANVKANQAAISAMVEKLLGRKVFVYSLDRLDCNKYYTDFSNKEQLNKLPNKKEIQLELPKGE